MKHAQTLNQAMIAEWRDGLGCGLLLGLFVGFVMGLAFVAMVFD